MCLVRSSAGFFFLFDVPIYRICLRRLIVLNTHRVNKTSFSGTAVTVLGVKLKGGSTWLFSK